MKKIILLFILGSSVNLCPAQVYLTQGTGTPKHLLNHEEKIKSDPSIESYQIVSVNKKMLSELSSKPNKSTPPPINI